MWSLMEEEEGGGGARNVWLEGPRVNCKVGRMLKGKGREFFAVFLSLQQNKAVS